MRSRTFVIAIALGVAAFCAVQLALTPSAAALESIRLRELSINAKSFWKGGHDPLITENGLPGRTLGEELNLIVKTDVFKYLYWNSTVISATDRVWNADGSTSPGQFRLVGLQMGLGIDFRRIPFLKWLPATLGVHHRSRHKLDGSYPWHFPVEDGPELNIYLFEQKEAR